MSLASTAAAAFTNDAMGAAAELLSAEHSAAAFAVHGIASLTLAVAATVGLVFAIKALAVGWLLAVLLWLLGSLLWAVGFTALKGNTHIAKASAVTADWLCDSYDSASSWLSSTWKRFAA